jgi:hypothetical protein
VVVLIFFFALDLPYKNEKKSATMDAYLAKEQLVDEPAESKSTRKRRKKREERQHGEHPGEENHEQEERHERADTDQNERQTALHKACHFCASADEFKQVARLRTPELQAWLEQKAYENYKEVAQSLVRALHYGLAQVADRVSRGDGYVADQIANDLTLAQAIHMEGSSLFKYINNRMRILLLLSIDVFEGKKKQRLHGAPREEEAAATAEGPAE